MIHSNVLTFENICKTARGCTTGSKALGIFLFDISSLAVKKSDNSLLLL